MKISTKIRYGLRMLINFAMKYGQGVSQLSDVAKNENVSEKYAEQIVRLLKLNKILISHRGAKGGYTLSMPPSKINVLMIWEALDGELNIIDCLRDADCSRFDLCVTRIVWEKLNKNIKETLRNITLQELADNYKKQRKEKLNYEI